MRWAVMLLAAGLVACGQNETTAASGAGGEAKTAGSAAGVIPTRAPGLWSQTMTLGDYAQTSKLCLDAAAEKQVSLWGQGVSGCKPGPVQRTADGWSFSSSCDMGEGGVTTTHGTVKGDFAKAYRVEAQSTTTGAATAQMNGDHAMIIDAVNEGPCPAGFAPGDLEVAGGVKVNILAMGKMAPAAP